MPSCVFLNCKNSSQKQKQEDGVSFHRFPTDAVLRNNWISIIRENRGDKDWLPSKFCVVCSTHFKEEDVYFTEKGRRLVKKKAKPTHGLLSPQENGIAEVSCVASKLSQATEIPGPSNENHLGFHFMVVNETPEKSTEISTEIEAVDLSMKDAISDSVLDADLESMFDTPTERQLRKKLLKQQFLRLRDRQNVRTLQNKVRRIKIRNCSLKNILKNLKDKHFINFRTDNPLRENIVASELFEFFNMSNSIPKNLLKYSPAMRKFCLTLHSYSPKAYQYVRKTFNSCLPHPKTLSRWYTHVKNEQCEQK